MKVTVLSLKSRKVFALSSFFVRRRPKPIILNPIKNGKIYKIVCLKIRFRVFLIKDYKVEAFQLNVCSNMLAYDMT